MGILNSKKPAPSTSSTSTPTDSSEPTSAALPACRSEKPETPNDPDSSRSDDRWLLLRQDHRSFAEAYLRSLDVKKAAIESGFHATYGYKLIQRADIRKALEQSMQCAVSALGVTAGEILAEIYELGQNCIEESTRLASLKFVHARLAEAEEALPEAKPLGEANSVETTIVRVPDNGRGPKP